MSDKTAAKAIFRTSALAGVSTLVAKDYMALGITDPKVIAGLTAGRISDDHRRRMGKIALTQAWEPETIRACAFFLSALPYRARGKTLGWVTTQGYDDATLRGIFELPVAAEHDKDFLGDFTKFVDAIGIDDAIAWWATGASLQDAGFLRAAGISPTIYEAPRPWDLHRPYHRRPWRDAMFLNAGVPVEDLDKRTQLSEPVRFVRYLGIGFTADQAARLSELTDQIYRQGGLTPAERRQIVRHIGEPDEVLIPVVCGCDIRTARRWAKYAEGRKYSWRETNTMSHGYGPEDIEFYELNWLELGNADFDVDKARQLAAKGISIRHFRMISNYTRELKMAKPTEAEVIEYLEHEGGTLFLEDYRYLGLTSLKAILPYLRAGLEPGHLQRAADLGLSNREALRAVA